MCDPVSIAAAVTTISQVKNVLAFAGKEQAYTSNKQYANAEYANTYNNSQQQGAQIDAQQSENATTAAINAVAARGRISASASSMGIDSATATQQGNAADFDVGRSLSIEDLNSENQRIQNAEELTGASLKRQSKIAEVSRPSVIGLATDVIGTNLKGVTQALKLGA